MKNLFFLISVVSIIFSSSCSDCKKPVEKPTNTALETESSEPVFDSIKAFNYGADDYGMKKYVVALLKSGPNRSKDEATKAKLQKAHMANITRMAEEGVLVLAGPFFGDDTSDLRGVYVFNVETIEEAKKLTETDPLIQSGGLVMELHLWYASAAVQKIGEIHETIQLKDF